MSSVIVQRKDANEYPVPRAHKFPKSVRSLADLDVLDPYRYGPIPEMGGSIIEPFGGRTTRAVNATGTGWGGYPTRAVESKNGDMLLIGSDVYMANTYESGPGPLIWGDTHWSNTVNDVIHGIQINTAVMSRWNITDGTVDPVFDFSSLLLAGDTQASIGPGSGNFSNDDRYVVVCSGRASGTGRTYRAWSFDMETQTVIATLDMDAAGPGLENIKITPDGNYIVGQEGDGFGTVVYDRDFTNKRQMLASSAHGDCALDKDGRAGYVAITGGVTGYEYYPVFCRCDDLSVVYLGRLDAAIPPNPATMHHASGRAINKPGYALINRLILDGEQDTLPGYILWASLEQGEMISPAGGLHVGEAYNGIENGIHPVAYGRQWGTEYFNNQVRAVAGRNGDRIMFGSRWYHAQTEADIYITEQI